MHVKLLRLCVADEPRGPHTEAGFAGIICWDWSPAFLSSAGL